MTDDFDHDDDDDDEGGGGVGGTVNVSPTLVAVGTMVERWDRANGWHAVLSILITANSTATAIHSGLKAVSDAILVITTEL